MNDKGRDFPQYRKLFNGKAFYRITGDRHFDEIQLVGSRKMNYSFVAEKYPEIIRIQDMINLAEGYLECTAEEFELLLDN